MHFRSNFMRASDLSSSWLLGRFTLMHLEHYDKEVATPQRRFLPTALVSGGYIPIAELVPLYIQTVNKLRTEIRALHS